MPLVEVSSAYYFINADVLSSDFRNIACCGRQNWGVNDYVINLVTNWSACNTVLLHIVPMLSMKYG